MTLLLTMMMTVAGTAHSDEATCRAVLQKCDLALKAQQEVNKTQEQIIQDQLELNIALKDQLSTQSIWKPIAIGGLVVIGVETLILVLRK